MNCKEAIFSPLDDTCGATAPLRCDPLNGDATNVLLPWGKTALVMFCLSCALFFVFVQRASRRVERVRKEHGDDGAAGGGAEISGEAEVSGEAEISGEVELTVAEPSPNGSAT